MPKYTPLTELLKRQPENSVELTFTEIERIIDNKLPSSARRWFTAWDNRTAALQDGWLNAGWKVVMVDLENERLKFQRKQGV